MSHCQRLIHIVRSSVPKYRPLYRILPQNNRAVMSTLANGENESIPNQDECSKTEESPSINIDFPNSDAMPQSHISIVSIDTPIDTAIDASLSTIHPSRAPSLLSKDDNRVIHDSSDALSMDASSKDHDLSSVHSNQSIHPSRVPSSHIASHSHDTPSISTDTTPISTISSRDDTSALSSDKVTISRDRSTISTGVRDDRSMDVPWRESVSSVDNDDKSNNRSRASIRSSALESNGRDASQRERSRAKAYRKKEIESTRAPIPPSLTDLEKKILDCSGKSINDNLEPMIDVISECIAIKSKHWRNCSHLIDKCHSLHQLYIKKGGHISVHYASKMIHMYANWVYSKTSTNELFKIMKKARLCNIASYRALVQSCYDDDTGDGFLARYIYGLYREMGIHPSEAVMRDLLITCVKRGSIELSFQFLIDFHDYLKIKITPPVFRVAFDIISIKKSIPFADKLVRFMLDREYALDIYTLNNYLRVVASCGNVDKALHIIDLCHSKNVSPTHESLNLLLRTFETNGEIKYILSDKGKDSLWKGIFPQHLLSQIYESREQIRSALDNNQSARSILSSGEGNDTQRLPIHVGNFWQPGQPLMEVLKFINVYQLDLLSTEYPGISLKILRRLAFIAGRYEPLRQFEVVVSHFKRNIGNGRMLENFSIIAHLLRGFERYSQYESAYRLFAVHCQSLKQRRQRQKTSRIGDLTWWDIDENFCDRSDRIYSYLPMLRMCSKCYHIDKFRKLGELICEKVRLNRYFRSQSAYNATLFFEAQASKHKQKRNDLQLNPQSNIRYETSQTKEWTEHPSSQTMTALLRTSVNTNDRKRALKCLKMITDQNITVGFNLYRELMATCAHFGFDSQCLGLFQYALRHSIVNKRLHIGDSIQCLVQSYVKSNRISELINLILFDPYLVEWWNHRLFTSINVARIMQCCESLNELEYALTFMQSIIEYYIYPISSQRDLTISDDSESLSKLSADNRIIIPATYNAFIRIIISHLGMFSDETLSAVQQFLTQNVWRNWNAHNFDLDISLMTREIVMCSLYLHIIKCQTILDNTAASESSSSELSELSESQSSESQPSSDNSELRFQIICDKSNSFLNRIEYNNRKMESGNRESLMSTAQWFLMTRFYPPLQIIDVSPKTYSLTCVLKQNQPSDFLGALT